MPTASQKPIILTPQIFIIHCINLVDFVEREAFDFEEVADWLSLTSQISLSDPLTPNEKVLRLKNKLLALTLPTPPMLLEAERIKLAETISQLFSF